MTAIVSGDRVAVELVTPDAGWVTVVVVGSDGRSVANDLDLVAFTTERRNVGVMVGGAVVAELVAEVTK